MNNKKIITIGYWVSTLLVVGGVGYSAIFSYLLDTGVTAEEFIKLGYPTYLVFPLGLAKMTALVVILFVKNKCLKHWAYSGLFYNFILAFVAHIAIQDDDYFAPVIMFVLLAISYITQCKSSKVKK